MGIAFFIVWGSMEKKTYLRMSLSVKCMVFHAGKILLLQKKDNAGLHPWEFPGGGVEFGENMVEAALREVKEETNLDVEILDTAGMWSYKRSKSHFLTGFIFIAESRSDVVKLSREHLAFAWVEPQNIEAFPLQPSLRKALRNIKPPMERGEELLDLFLQGYGKHYGSK